MKHKAFEQNKNWTEIQKAYEDKTQTIKEICGQYNLKQSELYKYAKANNWQLRSKKKKNLTSKQTELSKKESQNRHLTTLTTKQTQLRKPTETLQDALEFITMDLMQRIQQRTIESEADHDKDARTLSSLVRTYEKLKEMKTAPQSSNQKGEQKHSPIKKADEDAKRREIATSLEKLIQGL
ncbi:hypothetical protein NBRC116602_27660 [Hyphomicrobiales bacterium 4NK60-0047b]